MLASLVTSIAIVAAVVESIAATFALAGVVIAGLALVALAGFSELTFRVDETVLVDELTTSFGSFAIFSSRSFLRSWASTIFAKVESLNRLPGAGRFLLLLLHCRH